jgi:hypothetical protein
LRSRNPKEEPSKKTNVIPKDIRLRVWNKYFPGTTVGKCYVCHDPILNRDFQVGHNKARANGGTLNISNLRPICASCNRAMNKTSIEVYKARYFGKPKKKEVKKPNKAESKIVDSPKNKTGTEIESAVKDNNDDSLAMLEIKVRNYLTSQKFQILQDAHGFDVYARKGALLDADTCVAVNLNVKDTVTARYVLNYIDKLNKLNKSLIGTILISPKVKGLIAYTGELTEDISQIAKDNKPPVEFKKF